MCPTLCRRVLALLLVAVTALPMALFGGQGPKVIESHEKVFCATRLDDGVFVTGGFDGTVKLWMLRDGKADSTDTLVPTKHTPDPILCIAADPRFRYLVAGTKKGRVVLFGRTSYAVSGSKGATAVAVDAEGKRIAFATGTEVQFRLNPNEKATFRSLNEKAKEKVTALAWIDSRVLVAAGTSVYQYNLDANSQKKEWQFTGLPGKSIEALLGESKNADLYAVAVDEKGVIRRCRLRDPEKAKAVKLAGSSRIAFSGGKSFVTVRKEDNKFAIWDDTELKRVDALDVKDVVALAASRTGYVAFLVEDKPGVQLWDGKTTPVTTAPVTLGDVRLDVNSERRLAIHSNDERTSVAVAATRGGLSNLTVHTTNMPQLSKPLPPPLLPNAKYNAVAAASIVASWPLMGCLALPGQLLVRVPQVSQLAFAPNGKSLLTVLEPNDGTLYEINIADNTWSQFGQAPGKINKLAVGGSRVVAGVVGNVVRIWNADGKIMPALPAGPEVTCVALTADGGYLGWVEKEGAKSLIRVWQINENEPAKSLELQRLFHEAEITDFGLSWKDDKLAVVYNTSLKETYIREVDVEWALATEGTVVLDGKGTAALTFTNKGKTASYYEKLGRGEKAKAIGVDPNGEVISATLIRDKKIAAVSRKKGKNQLHFWVPDKPVQLIELPDQEVKTLSPAQDGKAVIVAYADATYQWVRLRDDGTPYTLEEALGKTNGKLEKPAFVLGLRDKAVIAGSTAEGLTIWEFYPTKEVAASDVVAGRPVCAVAWRPGTEVFLTGRSNGEVAEWGFTEGQTSPKRLRELPTLKSPVRAISFLSQDKSSPYIVAEADKNLHYWNADGTNVPLKRWTAPKGEIFSASVSPKPGADGKRLVATSSSDRKVMIHSFQNGSDERGPTLDHGDAVSAVAFHPKGEYLATVDFGGTIRAYPIKDNKVVDKPLLKTLPEPKPTAYSLVWADDDNLVIPAGDKLYLWNVKDVSTSQKASSEPSDTPKK